MITIYINGLDQYTVGHYSKEHTENLANLFETKTDDISFVAPQSFVLHEGVEQTSWNAIIIVHAPKQYEVFEAKIAKYLLGTLSEFSINLSVRFVYFEKKNFYEHINSDYPRFLRDDNLVNVAEDEEDDDSEDEEQPELYEGNMFEKFEEKLEESSHDHDECGCHHKH